jgi:hypothetical protein
MRRPLGRRVGSASRRSWPRSTKVSRMSCWMVRAIGDGAHGGAQLGHALDGLGHSEIRHVVGRGFRPQQEMIPHVLFDGAVAVIAADDGIRQVEVFDQRFEFAAMTLGDLSPEDGGEFRGLADGASGVEEPVAERVQCCAAVEDQVVAVFDLRQKQAVLTRGLAAFGGSERTASTPGAISVRSGSDRAT